MRFNENNIQKIIKYNYYLDTPDVLYFGGKAVN